MEKRSANSTSPSWVKFSKPKPNAEVALDIDVEGFNKLFEERVLNYLVNL